MTPEMLSRLRLKVAEELGATWDVRRWKDLADRDMSTPVLVPPGGDVWGPLWCWRYPDGSLWFGESCPDWPNSLDACMRDLPTTPEGRRIGVAPVPASEGMPAVWEARPEKPCRVTLRAFASTPAVAYVLCWLASRGVGVSEFQESA